MKALMNTKELAEFYLIPRLLKPTWESSSRHEGPGKVGRVGREEESPEGRGGVGTKGGGADIFQHGFTPPWFSWSPWTAHLPQEIPRNH